MTDRGTPRAAIRLGPDNGLRRGQRLALRVGLVAGVLCVVGALFDPTQALRSYLVAYLFWLGMTLGCLAILMIHHVAGGRWSAVIRRLLESGTRTVPLMALLFLPVALGTHQLYEWAHHDVVARDAVLQAKSAYLNVPFFLARAVFYFAVWLALMGLLNRWSLAQDATDDPGLARRMALLSRGGLVFFGFTMTFASIDWVMSLEPHWFSTIYGVLVIGGQAVAAMGLMIALAAVLAERDGGPLAGVIGKQQFHDLGKLLLAFVMLWAYFMLSQFLIIWAGNLPEEIPWYLRRSTGGWQIVTFGLIALQFVLPFLILLSRDVKEQPRRLMSIAVLVVVAQFVDVFWLVSPAFHPGALVIHWLDLVTPIAVGGIWFAMFVRQLASRPLLAVNDPSLPGEAVAR